MSNARDYLGLGQQGTTVPARYLIALVIISSVVWGVMGAIWNGVAGLLGFLGVLLAGLGAFAWIRLTGDT